MPKFDWNNNGKKDIFDQYMDMKVMSNESYDVDTDDFDLDDKEDIYDLEHEENKYSWRESYIFDFELDPEDYETEEEYLEALELERSSKNVSELSIIKNSLAKNRTNTNINNSKIYKYCKVMLDSFNKQFENKYDKRFCIYFKDISIGVFLNQEEYSSIALSGNQKQLKEVPFVFDVKIPEDLRNYNEIEFKVCYGRIEEG